MITYGKCCRVKECVKIDDYIKGKCTSFRCRDSHTSISEAPGQGLATGKTTIMLSKKSLQIALHESVVRVVVTSPAGTTSFKYIP